MGIHKPEVKSSRHHVGRPQAQGHTRDQQVPASYRELTYELTHFSSGKEEKPELEKRTKGKKSSSLYYGQEDSITGDSNQTNSFTAKPPQPSTTNMCDRRDNTFQEDFSNITVDLTPACAGLATGNNLCRDFNTVTSELNTPDITDMDIGNILAHPDIDLADLINTADSDIDTRMETREDVWGYESFDVFQTPDYGLCLPATLVEGSQDPPAADDDSLNVPDSALLEEYQNIDILKWIVEDQDIDPVSSSKVPEQSEDVKRVSVIVPVSSPSTAFYINALPEKEEKEVKVKMENLTEDEKYRRMRLQNNDASKRCREKRKRKQQDMEEELIFLQDKNQSLKDKVELMEREVRAMKRRLLDDVRLKKS